MKYSLLGLALASSLLFTGCATTPSKPLSFEQLGQYSTTPLNVQTYRISFLAGHNMSFGTAEEITLVKAAQKIHTMGPEFVIIKKGEHGALLFHNKEVFFAPALPLEEVFDPTGAGDTFAGGFAGYIAQSENISFDIFQIDFAVHEYYLQLWTQLSKYLGHLLIIYCDYFYMIY